MSNQTNDLYQYSETEKQRIYQAIAKVTAQTTGEEPTAIGNWVPFYQELSLIMAEHINNPVGISSDNLTDMKNFKLWLDVAIGANGGTGMHSAFIRTFTDVQGELRIGRKFTDAEMQLASNGVAFNLWKDIKGENRDKPEIAWKVGKIGAVADSDASSIGKNLYDKIANLPDKDDTAITTNAGWSGTIGFNLLGGVPPFESDRLYNGNNEDGKFDKLDDLKNILFAVYSYEQAFKAGAIAGAKNLSELLLLKVPDDLEAQWNIARSSGNYIGLILGVLERTPIVYDVAQVILGFGYENFLDIMIGTITGEVPKQKTTTENFVNNAQEFFNKFSGMELREKISVIALPEKIEDIMSLAKNDIGVRVALKNLSPFSFSGIDYAQHNSNGELSLYSKDNPNGLTEIYLTKRAEMLSAWLQDKIDPYYTPNNAFIDIDLDIRLDEPKIDYGHGNNGIRQHQSEIIFGGTGNDTIKAKDVGDNNNFLFGGTGNDTLIGNSGNDYLEGGQGFDTYHITDHDTIYDSDGQGKLIFSGNWLKKAPAITQRFIQITDNLWHNQNKDKQIIYTAIKQDNDLTITYLQDNHKATLKDFFKLATHQHNTLSFLNIHLQQSANKPKPTDLDLYTNPDYVANVYTGGFMPTSPDEFIQLPQIHSSHKGDNIFATGTQAFHINTGAGNDLILASSSADVIYAGSGNDVIYGSSAMFENQPNKPKHDDDIIYGGDGNDLIFGGVGSDVIYADDSYNNTLTNSDQQGDWLVGGSGHDVLFGSQRQDFLQGGIGSDTLFGGSGHDVLLGDGNIRFAQKSNSIYDLSYFCRTI